MTGSGTYSNQVKINDNYFYTTTDNANKQSGYDLITLTRATKAEVTGNQFYVNDTYGNAIGGGDGGYHLVANNYIYLSNINGGITSKFVNSNGNL
jgi:hypothetical protein